MDSRQQRTPQKPMTKQADSYTENSEYETLKINYHKAIDALKSAHESLDEYAAAEIVENALREQSVEMWEVVLKEDYLAMQARAEAAEKERDNLRTNPIYQDHDRLCDRVKELEAERDGYLLAIENLHKECDKLIEKCQRHYEVALSAETRLEGEREPKINYGRKVELAEFEALPIAEQLKEYFTMRIRAEAAEREQTALRTAYSGLSCSACGETYLTFSGAELYEKNEALTEQVAGLRSALEKIICNGPMSYWEHSTRADTIGREALEKFGGVK